MEKKLNKIKHQEATNHGYGKDGWFNFEILVTRGSISTKQLSCLVGKIAESYAQSQTQELTDWKESMMKVHSELDLQGIGNALGLPLGSSIAPRVLPEIIGLIERNKELIEALQNVANLLESDSQISVERIKRVLTKHNHLNKKP